MSNTLIPKSQLDATLVDLATAQVLTNKDLSSGTNTFPTFNQNTSGNAATVTTNANLTGDITSVGNATTIGTAKVTLAMQANMATGSLVYRKTAAAGTPEIQTLATLKTDLGLTGTNSGDQTSIVGITGTTAQFNTALTDNDFATLAGSETLTNKTLTTPVINGLPTGTGVATANTASTLVARDGSGNFSAGTITATTFVGAGTSLTGIPYTITGTANQVVASAGTGNITLSLPQSIATSSTPQFARLGIGAAADATRPLYVTGNVSGGNALFERVNATTNAVVGTVIIQGTSTGTAADGFGSAFQFAIADNTGGPNNIADIRGIRSGSLTGGKMTFSTNQSGGSMIEAMAISNTQIVTLTNAGTTAGSVATIDGTQTLTAKTLTTPVINGTITGTGQATTATASTIAMRDANANTAFNNTLLGFTTTATAAGTTTLTIASTYVQVFTGATTQTVLLPTTSVPQGDSYQIINQSTGAVTVQSSGANTITILAAGTSGIFTAVVATPTTAANWNSQYSGIVITSAKKLSVSNTITLAGTDSTTMTFPSTSATIARTDAANTFTGVQTFTAPILGTPTSVTLTNATGLPIAGLVASTSTALGVGSVELGHATDTTLARSAAGVVTIEGVVVTTEGSTTEASSATTTIAIAGTRHTHTITALAAADAVAAPTSAITLSDKNTLVIRIKDNGTARALTWNAIFRASSDLALPSTTIISKTLYLGFKYNVADTKWDLLSVLNNI